MTLDPGGRPLFIDPAPVVAGGEVGEARAPLWFRAVAVVVATIALYYLFAFWSGPRLTSPHNFTPAEAESTDGTDAPAEH